MTLFFIPIITSFPVLYQADKEIVQCVSNALLDNDIAKKEIRETFSRHEGMTAKAIMENVVESFIDNYKYHYDD